MTAHPSTTRWITSDAPVFMFGQASRRVSLCPGLRLTSAGAAAAAAVARLRPVTAPRYPTQVTERQGAHADVFETFSQVFTRPVGSGKEITE